MVYALNDSTDKFYVWCVAVCVLHRNLEACLAQRGVLQACIFQNSFWTPKVVIISFATMLATPDSRKLASGLQGAFRLTLIS